MTTQTESPAARQERLIEEAMTWILIRETGPISPAQQADFDAWLSEHPEHAVIYARSERDWRGLAGLRDMPAAQAAAHRHRVASTHPQRRRRWAVAAAAAASLMVAAVLVMLRPAGESAAPLSQQYATAVAEIRDITLSDGSRLTLGAHSRVEVHFAADARHASLLEGEAFFSVQRDADRPFTVRAGATEVRVLGTRFNVRLGPDVVEVAVEEGRVEVHDPAIDTSDLVAGEQLITARPIATDTRRAPVPVQRSAAPAHVGAWRDGRLDYNNARLLDVIADARRYHAGRIELRGEALQGLRVTTSFRADQVLPMLESLEGVLPVQVERRGSDVVLSPPAAPPG